MDITTMINQLHARVNSSTTLEEILVITKTIEQLKLGIVNTVSVFGDLAGLNGVNGEVYFVESENRLYVGVDTSWYRIYDPVQGLAYSWGANGSGQLADITTVNKSSPVSVWGLISWTQVSAGLSHTMAIDNLNRLWTWGYNNSGQLGDNTTVTKSSPVSVVGGFTDWTQVSAGQSFTVAVRANGSMWTWGYNNSGQLGDNTTVSKRSPVSVMGGFTDWTQASAGSNHTVAVRANGTAWSWGLNSFGRLGDNTTVNKSSPVSVVGGFTNWTQVSAGNTHILGVRGNGTLWAWGSNSEGAGFSGGWLGNGNRVSSSSPVSVVGGFTNWVQAAAGRTSSMGLRGDGTIWSWGSFYGPASNNPSGVLGTNSSINRSSPGSIVGGFTDWSQVSLRSDSVVALRTNGTAWSWGFNSSGQLGDGTTVSRSSPVSVVGGLSDWAQVSAGNSHTVVLRYRGTP